MAKGKEPKFEEAVEELEAIITKIESGQCGLEECIAEYERGVKLLGRCQEVLQTVQKRIAELTTGPNGRLLLKEAAETSELTDDEGGSPDPEAGAGGSSTPEHEPQDDNNPSAEE